MNKYQILLEYVGTKYVGWQSQKNGRSIQNTVQLYLSKLLKKKITIYGACLLYTSPSPRDDL